MVEGGDEDDADDPFAAIDDLDMDDDLDVDDDLDMDDDLDVDDDLDADDDIPLADLAREVRERSASAEAEAGADTDAGRDDPFEPVDVAEVDDEAVWESFVEGEDGPEAGVGLGAEVHEASAADDHVVSKREFCQQCPHFSDPPAVTCTHEGTTIVEVVDADDFRVRNCPIVAERRESRID
ncbi:hypothetical protein [Haloplanus salilacus]|uniref:hypothetical protein n=1 Tax=Haloplanus salilacus TaxID=2949994 RepID=UPI0030D3390F